MTDPRFIARRIAVAIAASRVNLSTEITAHTSLAAILRERGFDVATEVRLTDKDRIDIMVGGVGVEVKVAGGRRDIYRQLERYAASDQIEALVLATAGAWPAQMTVIGEKPFFLASLHSGWL